MIPFSLNRDIKTSEELIKIILANAYFRAWKYWTPWSTKSQAYLKFRLGFWSNWELYYIKNCVIISKKIVHIQKTLQGLHIRDSELSVL